jgi:hypothetical protein
VEAYEAKIAREKAERDRAERAFNAALNHKDPQAMYLSAGGYERNGEAYKAQQIYESLILRFPSSQWAVKANDQLNATKRANDAERSAQQRQYEFESARSREDSNAKTQCSIRIDSCKTSCRGMSDSVKYACWNRCESICTQY